MGNALDSLRLVQLGMTAMGMLHKVCMAVKIRNDEVRRLYLTCTGSSMLAGAMLRRDLDTPSTTRRGQVRG